MKKDWQLYTKEEIEEYQRELVYELRNTTNPDGTRFLDEKTITGYAYGDKTPSALNAMAQMMQYNTPRELADMMTM